MIPGAQTLRNTLLISIALAVSSAAGAQHNIEYTWETHFADHLPLYCKYTQRLPDRTGTGQGGIQGLHGHPLSSRQFSRVYGAAWHHMHHYCYALDDLYLASLQAEPAKARTLLGQSIKEIQYVIDRTDRSWVLLPEALFNIGIAHLGLGNNMEAVRFLTACLVEDPAYVPAYLMLANYFQRLGDKNQAASILRKGLANAPNADVLSDRLRTLEPSSDPGSE